MGTLHCGLVSVSSSPFSVLDNQMQFLFERTVQCMLLGLPFPGKWPLLGPATLTCFQAAFPSCSVSEERWCSYRLPAHISSSTCALQSPHPCYSCYGPQPKSGVPSVLTTLAEKLQIPKAGTFLGVAFAV